MMKTIRISRAKWLTQSISVLWDSCLKKGCCLGHALHQIEKIPWKELDGKGMPDEVGDGNNCLTDEHEFGHSDSQFAMDATEINDDLLRTRKEKEKDLRKLFRENGYRLIFTP